VTAASPWPLDPTYEDSGADSFLRAACKRSVNRANMDMAYVFSRRAARLRSALSRSGAKACSYPRSPGDRDTAMQSVPSRHRCDAWPSARRSDK
jgi:hypothetical protein